MLAAAVHNARAETSYDPSPSSARKNDPASTDSSPSSSPSAPTHTPTQRGKDDGPGTVVPEGGRIDEMTRRRTTDDTIRDILRDKKGK